VPVSVVVAPLKFIVPAPLKGPLSTKVPLWKSRAPPEPAEKAPEQDEPQFPPLRKEIVPLFPFTVPVLLKGTVRLVVPVPLVFSKVPALLTVEAIPPPKPMVLSLAKFQMAPVWLLMMEPF